MKKIWNADQKLYLERALQGRGMELIAGTDEAGRGPLAGPVVCAAVILPLDAASLIEGVDDSKKLSEAARERLDGYIRARALAFAVCEESSETIDRINILEATKLCMKRAVEALDPPPSAVLVDGDLRIDVACAQQSIVGGDALSYSVGAASILAKVYRDARMREYDKLYPQYGFAVHKGYGTKRHIDAIREFGLCAIHRRTFTKKFWAGAGNAAPPNS